MDFTSEAPFELRAGALAIGARLGGLDRMQPGGAFLVAAAGAGRFSRGMGAPQHFPGLTLARALGAPILSFADARVADRGRVGPEVLRIAEGAGMDVPAAIAATTEAVARAHGARPVMMGESGSGFILLNALRHLAAPAGALVWNSPTGIDDGLAAGMGRHLAPATGGAVDEARLVALGRQVLRGVGLADRLAPADLGGAAILMLQGRTDALLRRGLGPFMAEAAWDRLGPHAFAAKGQPLAVALGDWGAGHAPPPPEVLHPLLRALLEGSAPADLARGLGGGPGPGLLHLATDRPGPEAMRVAVSRGGGRIEARLALDGHPGLAPLEVAFTLFRDREQLADRPFAPEPSAGFPDPGGPGLSLRVTLRDFSPEGRLARRVPVPDGR